MSLLSVAGTAGNAALQWLESLTNTNKTASPTNSSCSSAVNSNGTANLSQVGQFYAKLDSLAQSSPTEFKQITSQISSELNSAAQQATGTTQQFLQQLANNFQTASQTGSTASLATQPPSAQPVSGAMHHHHHHHGGGGYNASQNSQSDLLSALSGSSSSGTGGSNTDPGTSSLQSLFQNIYNQVMSA